MNMTCSTVRDLTELYKADLVSEESDKAIRAHLKTCPECRRYYRKYDLLDDQGRTVRTQPSDDFAGTESRLYEDLSRRLARHRFLEIVGTSAAIGAGTIMVTIGVLLMMKSAHEKL